MDKNKPDSNNDEKIINNKNNSRKKTQKSPQIISTDEIQIKENNISKSIFSGIPQDMITIMPKNIPNLIIEKEPENKDKSNNEKNNSSNENNNNPSEGRLSSNLDEQIEH